MDRSALNNVRGIGYAVTVVIRIAICGDFIGSVFDVLTNGVFAGLKRAEFAEMRRRGVVTSKDLGILRLREEMAPSDFSPQHRVPVSLMTGAERGKRK